MHTATNVMALLFCCYSSVFLMCKFPNVHDCYFSIGEKMGTDPCVCDAVYVIYACAKRKLPITAHAQKHRYPYSA